MEKAEYKEKPIQIQSSPDQPQPPKTIVSNMRGAVSFSRFTLIIILAAFIVGLSTTKLPDLISRVGNQPLSLRTSPSFLPSKDGLFRSHSAVIEGEIKKIEGDKIILTSGGDEIIVKLSERFVKSKEASKETTDSSGRRVPPQPVLPDLKVGDKVQAGLVVVDGETVVTSIFVDK